MPQRKILYWKGVAGDATALEEDKPTIEKLLHGEYQAVSLEKLQGSEPTIYSVRSSICARLLFTTVTRNGSPYLLLLEKLPNHEYGSSHFLRSGVAARYLGRERALSEEGLSNLVWLSCEESRLSFETDCKEEIDSEIWLTPASYYDKKFIEFTTTQHSAIQTINQKLLPGIQYADGNVVVVSGDPGSGKSCLGITALQSFVEHLQSNLYLWEDLTQEERPSILYITSSPRLVQAMQEMWESSPFSADNPCNVLFWTYNHFLNAIEPELAQHTRVGATEFNDWVVNYRKRLNRQKKKDYLYLFENSSTLYQELRIIAGHTLHTYLEIGEKQSSFFTRLTPQEKQVLFATYQSYTEFLRARGEINPELFYSNNRLPQSVLRIIGDEVQDLSPAQLKTLFASNRSALYLMDRRQNIQEQASTADYFESRLKACNLTITHIHLHTTFRCERRVAELASYILMLKSQVIGGTLNKGEELTLAPADGANEGTVLLLTDISDEHISQLRSEAQNIDFAVITWEPLLEEAREFFKTPLVFTPDEIKGLGYGSIAGYKLLDNPAFKEANSILAHTENVPPLSRVHRPKNRTHINLNQAFNSLFVAITRAEHKFIFVEPSPSRDLSHIRNYIREAISTPTDTIPPYPAESKTQNSEMEWLQHALQLEEKGYTEVAQNIFDQYHYSREEAARLLGFKNRTDALHLKLPNQSEVKSETTSKERKVSAETTKKTLTNHSSKQKARAKKNTIPVANNPITLQWQASDTIEQLRLQLEFLISSPLRDKLVKDATASVKNRSKKNFLAQNLGQAFLNNPLLLGLYLAWNTDLAYGFLSAIAKINKTFFSKITEKHLNTQVTLLGQSHTVIHWMSQTREGSQFLKEILLDSKPKEPLNVDWQECNEKGVSTLYCLLKYEPQAFFLIIKKRPEQLREIPFEEWFRPCNESVELSNRQVFFFPLLELMYHAEGATCFYEILRLYPPFLEVLFANEWEQIIRETLFPEIAASHALIVLANIILQNKGMTGERLLAKVGEYNPQIFLFEIVGLEFEEKRIKQLLYQPEQLSLLLQSFQGRNSYYAYLIFSSHGSSYLVEVIKDHENDTNWLETLSQLFASNLDLFRLSLTKEEGQNVLYQLLECYPPFTGCFSPEILNSEIVDGKSLLFTLSRTSAGCDILNLLFERDPDLLKKLQWLSTDINSSPVLQLLKPNSNQQIDNGISLFYDVLQDLPELLPVIPADYWITPLYSNQNSQMPNSSCPLLVISWGVLGRPSLDYILRAFFSEYSNSNRRFIPTSAWFNYISEPESLWENTSPFYWLCIYEHKTHFLDYLIEHDDEFVEFITGAELSRKISSPQNENFGTSPLYWLLLHARTTFFKLIQKKPSLLTDIPCEAWFFPSVSISTTLNCNLLSSPMYWIVTEEEGFRYGESLNELNPDFFAHIAKGGWDEVIGAFLREENDHSSLIEVTLAKILCTTPEGAAFYEKIKKAAIPVLSPRYSSLTFFEAANSSPHTPMTTTTEVTTKLQNTK